jgi:1-deoxy-D-xylulose-5-phosphate synthase
MVAEAQKVAARLAAEDRLSVGVVNARFAKPLDRELLLRQAAVVPLLVTLEDHAVTGGFGSAVLEAVQEAGAAAAVERIGWPDRFIEHGTSVKELRAAHGLAPDDLLRRIRGCWRELRGETAPANPLMPVRHYH